MHDSSPNAARVGEEQAGALAGSLPSIPHAPGARFELAESTALGLLEALLSESAARQRHIETWLNADPNLQAWAQAVSHGSLDADQSLADWFSDHLPALLRWPEEQCRKWRLAAILHLAAERIARLELLSADFNEALHSAKLDSLKELAYGASHEINNPLANISMRAQSLLTGESDPQRRQKLAQIHTQALRAHEMIADLMLFARPPKLKPAEVDVRSIAQQQVASLLPHANEQGTTLSLSSDTTSTVVHADASQIGVVIRSLIINALEALGAGGAIQVLVAPGSASLQPGQPTSRTVTVTVEDNGPGIAESALPHVFDPFFSGREAGRGLGFGLTKAWRIINTHGGRIWHTVPAGGGAAFHLALPVTAENAGD